MEALVSAISNLSDRLALEPLGKMSIDDEEQAEHGYDGEVAERGHSALPRVTLVAASKRNRVHTFNPNGIDGPVEERPLLLLRADDGRGHVGQLGHRHQVQRLTINAV